LLELRRKRTSFFGHQTPRLRWQYYHLDVCPESLSHYNLDIPSLLQAYRSGDLTPATVVSHLLQRAAEFSDHYAWIFLAREEDLGTYTNFMNLLNYSAISVPSGFLDTGLPLGCTLFMPAFQDEALLALASRLHPLASNTVGAPHRAAPEPSAHQPQRGVVGNHRNSQLLPHVPAGRGAAPAPLGIGQVKLADGRWVSGFICEPIGLEGAEEITHLGGWRGFLQSR
jgi:hypothetical protein